MAEPKFIKVKESEEGQRLDRWMKKNFPDVPFSLLNKLLRKGALRIDRKRAKVDTKLIAGQEIKIPAIETGPEQKKAPITQEDRDFIRSLIIYEDEDLIALNKPAGIATQGGSKTKRHIDGLLDGLTHKNQGKPKLVHRLDKETSGVLLLAKSVKSAKALGYLFKGKEIEKHYLALVAPAPEQNFGQIEAPLRKAGGPAKERMVLDPEEGKQAITDFVVLDRAAKKAALMIFRPLTGRTHQIRIHAADALQTPIIGDFKYGKRADFIEGLKESLHLHAYKLSFTHPFSNKTITVKAPLSEDLKKSFQMLGFDWQELSHAQDPFSVLD